MGHLTFHRFSQPFIASRIMELCLHSLEKRKSGKSQKLKNLTVFRSWVLISEELGASKIECSISEASTECLRTAAINTVSAHCACSLCISGTWAYRRNENTRNQRLDNRWLALLQTHTHTHSHTHALIHACTHASLHQYHLIG